MTAAMDKKHRGFSMNDRRLSIIVLSLFSSWLLSVPFEGRILYALMDACHVSAPLLVFGAMAAHFAGLILCSFFVKNMRTAKRLMLVSTAFCIAASAAFFFPFSFWWEAALFLSSFLAGCFVAAWGFFLKGGTPEGERSKTIADMLIASYILVTLLGAAATGLSAQAGLGLSMLMLGAAFLFALKLPSSEAEQSPPSIEPPGKPTSITKPLAFLCLFIVTSALNVGLMFHVQAPAYAHLGELTNWYWAVPYIVAVLIVRNLPVQTNRAYILYAAIAMTGFSFIAFILMDRSAVSYLVVDTLMLGAFGIFNLFWWTILGEMLSFHQNPARVLGIGLSANVLGALLGALIGNADAFGSGQGANVTLLSLGVVCVTLVMLPPLHARLTELLKSHAYLTAFSEMPEPEQTRLIRESATAEKLTEREAEIATLLIRGKTYRIIAEELHISENTVRTHVKNIYSKCAVRNRVELVNVMMAEQNPPTEP